MPPAPVQLPRRDRESHKGDFGRALLVGGSCGMSGAIAMAGMATLRSGAGLVTLAVPDDCLETVASFEPSYMTFPLAADPEGRFSVDAIEELMTLAPRATCIACGPGIGQSKQLVELVGWMYTKLEQPLVIDADGLNNLAARGDGLNNPGGPRILTPHPGEFRRLIGSETLSIDPDPSRAVQLAADHGIIIALKGHRTLVTDGERTWHNTTGNPGMATGGSGDVLTGVITGLICQGLSPLEATQLGVYVHGLAGDLGAENLGEVSLIASDLIDYLPEAFAEISTP